jgi:hypothetical protein
LEVLHQEWQGAEKQQLLLALVIKGQHLENRIPSAHRLSGLGFDV